MYVITWRSQSVHSSVSFFVRFPHRIRPWVVRSKSPALFETTASQTSVVPCDAHDTLRTLAFDSDFAYPSATMNPSGVTTTPLTNAGAFAGTAAFTAGSLVQT